ncbi:signal recognition particle protein Srp54 [Methanococcus voltae]|uniref:Signal recognition particle 54 kDa protein n=2 Tax=Methanococcus voltae TaxID=2188 RepID=A0A8J7RCS4_METVO|nr:signal recognition particle protein Srp54 [Methanococcus voltae]MBP2172191.1 signal recognition particle subunit SRP54 [Methanococcus voltae]MBP2200852.1 signal recognition particle subunit SRP54 [Methanococcus voltae]MCS3921576.1 signal recognition particle subunit SRP54 [Methanococcus voltae PS]
MLDKLGQNISTALNKIKSATLVDKKLIKEVIKDIQKALIQSDVNVKLVLKMSKDIEKKAIEENPPKGLSKKEHIVQIVYNELVQMIGTEPQKLDLDPSKKSIILLVGIQGSGKTTSSAKLARLIQKRGLKPALIAADVYRPAAYKQLQQLSEKINVPLYGDETRTKTPIEIAKDGLNKLKKADVFIIDTAGRHKEESGLLTEMKELKDELNPKEIILVIDGTLGQQAKNQAKAFKDAVEDIGSILVTKLDGSAKGGGALSAVAEINAPIKFIGTGEGVDDLETFDPKKFISRLLGMGDLDSLLEKTDDIVEDANEEDIEAILKGKFTLVELYSQLETISKMGPMKQILSMIPGMGASMPKEAASLTEQKLKRYKILMDSMTEEEKENPELIKTSRMQRIARGAGAKQEEIKELLKYYQTTKNAFSNLKRGKMLKMGGQMGKIMRQIMYKE